MCKAILVIDMPENCKECELMFPDEYSYWCPCNYVKENTTDIYEHIINLTKPDWCPLRELPEKYDIKEYLSKPHDRDYDFEFEGGYNACIDEILNNDK